MGGTNDRERLLGEALDANRLKDEFFSTLSHELPTPLTAILGWVQLVRVRAAAAESVTTHWP
jgi:signal transduction histidine kinase